jgi:hypothetical protein
MTEQIQARYPDHDDSLQKAPNSLEEPEPKKPSDAPSAPPLPTYPAISHTRHHPIGLYRVSELKEIKKDSGNYTENPDQYIQAFREVSQNFELSWKDVMLLLPQTLTSLDKQQLLHQAAGTGDDYHLDKCGPTGLSQTGPHRRRRGREKKDKDTGYLKRNLNSQF